MNKLIFCFVGIMLLIPTVSMAWTSSSISIGFSGGSYCGYGHGGLHYSSTRVYHHRHRMYYGGHHVRRVVIRHMPYYPVHHIHHIHRQEGRRYVNDYPCAPVVVVPSGARSVYYGY
jgi:hypothetical protein